MAGLVHRRSPLVFASLISLVLLLLGYGAWRSPTSAQSFTDQLRPFLSEAIAHPLPQTLQAWRDPSHSGDYFDRVSPTDVGYLVWTRFPIRIYLAPQNGDPPTVNPSSLADWQGAVRRALDDWNQYLPLTLTPDPGQADITIYLAPPPLQLVPDVPTPADRPAQLPLARVRSAEARY
ncbi:MAG: hypothetical protein VKK04_27190, partial [Synechococcales bacterium]|nr:hypothetical protein [Synechococcales bacterium]